MEFNSREEMNSLIFKGIAALNQVPIAYIDDFPNNMILPDGYVVLYFILIPIYRF